MTDAPASDRRPWWPWVIGIGLVAAAVVGLVVIRSTNDVEPAETAPTIPEVTEPTDSTAPTVPTTEPVATETSPVHSLGVRVMVDGDCVLVESDAGAATGCLDDPLDDLDQRTMVANTGEPVLVSFADGSLTSAMAVNGQEYLNRCGRDQLEARIPTGEMVEVVACTDDGVMGLRMATSGDESFTPTYFTLPTPYVPDGAELGAGAPIEGLPGAVTFAVRLPEGVTCSVLLPAGNGWKEFCWNPELGTIDATLVRLDDATVYEATFGDDGAIASATRLDRMAPSSGCTLGDAQALMALLPPSSIATGIGCLDDRASIVTGSVLLQAGPPDGSIWLTEKSAADWAITDTGTGLEGDAAFPIVPVITWSTWPSDTAPHTDSTITDRVAAVGAQPDPQALASEIVGALAGLPSDPDFPPDPRVIATEPDGAPLIVIETTVGGDDSVSGQIFYVWFNEAFDSSGPIGVQASHVLISQTCLRGGSADDPLCV